MRAQRVSPPPIQTDAMASLTIENYVKAIYKLSGAANHPAATGRLATELQVSPGTVTSMLKTLSEGGLAEYQPYEGARLTEQGRALALRVLRRHRLIELFLVRTLDLEWDEVHDEAENMEHAVSDYLVDRMDQYLGRPDFDPHGDPIPRADLTLRAAEGQSLAAWPDDQPFRLIRVLDQSSEFLRRLTEQGVTLGILGSARPDPSNEGLVIRWETAEGTIERRLPRRDADKLLVVEP